MEDLVRLSKLMFQKGMCSRREADDLIRRGWVEVDGRVESELGTKVAPKVRISLKRGAKKTRVEKVTILLRKPVGCVSGQAEMGYEPAAVLIRPHLQIENDPQGPLKSPHV